jgi:hypothetical protein
VTHRRDSSTAPGRQPPVGRQRRPLVGVGGQHVDRARHEAASGLVPRHQQGDAEHHDLVVGEPAAAHRGSGQLRHQVVAGRPGPVAHVGIEEGEQLGGRGGHRRVVGPVADVDHRVGPATELRPISHGDGQEVGDDGHRDRSGEAGDEVDLHARRRLDGQGVEHLDGARPDAGGEALDRPGRESAVEQRPVLGVPRRVEVQQRPGVVVGPRPAERVVDQGAVARAEPVGAAADRPDVVVAGDEHVPVAEVVDRRLGPQPGEGVPVVGAQEEAGLGDVEPGQGGGGGHRGHDGPDGPAIRFVPAPPSTSATARPTHSSASRAARRSGSLATA